MSRFDELPRNTKTSRTTTLNYDGGGWTIPYLIGISARLSESALDLSDTNVTLKYAGVSAGACVALASALGVSMDDLMEDVMKASDVCRPCPLLTLSAVRLICMKMIKDDEQVRRLSDEQSFAVGITRVAPLQSKPRFIGDGKLSTVVVSSFESKNDLIEKVVSSCRLPMINTLPRGKPHEYIDGNLLTRFIEVPWRNEHDREVRVSPNKDAEGSDVSCREIVPLQNHVVPFERDGLMRLYELGKADGYDVLNRILLSGPDASGKKILRTGQETYEDDWSTRFDQRLHVDRRRDLRLPEAKASPKCAQGAPRRCPFRRDFGRPSAFRTG